MLYAGHVGVARMDAKKQKQLKQYVQMEQIMIAMEK